MRVHLGCLLLSRPTATGAFRRCFPSLLLATTNGRTSTNRRSTTNAGSFLFASCHLNHAGASPSPKSVTERVVQHLELEQEIGGYAAAAMVETELAQVYQNVAKLIHAADASQEIALVESATVAWTRAFYAMAEMKLLPVQERVVIRHKEENNVILISDAEYAANVVAACQWARVHGWTVLSIPSSLSQDDDIDGKKSTGMVDPTVLEEMLSGSYRYKNEQGQSTILDPSRIAMACITHVPTNSGIVNPVEEIGQQISAYNAQQEYANQIVYLVDACQSVGQLSVNVQTIQCHALVATGRKYLRGPRGTGFLYVSSSSPLVNNLMPSHVDHFGVPIQKVPQSFQNGDTVQNILEFAPRKGATRFEFWESNVANRLGLGKAVRHAMEEIGSDTIERDCRRLAKILRSRIARMPSIVVHHEMSTSCGIVTFYSKKLDSQTIKEEMSIKNNGYELSVVPATSTPLDSAKTMVPDLVRASISYTNTAEEIESFCQSLESLLE